MSDHRPMWASLGLDLDRHDSLLEMLGGAYAQIYMSQADRPEAMKYFDIVVSEAHGLRIAELVEHKRGGGTVVGTFCVYVPEEVVFAAGGVPVGLCAGADFAVPYSDGLIPRNTCPLIRASLGFKMNRTCPYIQCADFVVGETTCDGKKKMFEVLAEHHPTYVMEVPQTKSAGARELFVSELKAFVGKMESVSGRKIDAAGLAAATAKVEKKKAALRRVHEARKADCTPISGLDALLVSQISFYDDIDRFTAKVNELADELEARVAKGTTGNRKPRILFAGTPLPLPDWKLHSIVEACGGVIVCEESCVGSRYYSTTTPASDGSLEGQLRAISTRLLDTHCACFTPNAERIDDIIGLAREYRADGVICYSLAFCQTYAAESIKVENALKAEGIPVLSLESDFSANDAAQLRTRVGAFIEMIA